MSSTPPKSARCTWEWYTRPDAVPPKADAFKMSQHHLRERLRDGAGMCHTCRNADVQTYPPMTVHPYTQLVIVNTHTHAPNSSTVKCLTCPGGRKRRYGCSSRLCVAEFTVCSDVRVVTKSAEQTPLLSRPGKLRNPPFTLNLLYVCCARCRCCVTGRLTLAHNTHTHTHTCTHKYRHTQYSTV